MKRFILIAAVLALTVPLVRAAGQRPAPRNVILIVPDGCNIPLWAAVRMSTVGVDGELNIDLMPVQGRCRTYSANSLITDSAASGTAYACGVKTVNGVLGMDATTVRGDSLSGNAVPSILELAERAGYVTGIVTTASVQHATPGAFYTHTANRDWYERIALDLPSAGIEVILGGGRQYMIPGGTTDDEGGRSRRRDDRDLVSEMKAGGYTYVADQAGFDALDTSQADRVLGLFNPEHMAYEFDRAGDPAGEPALWEMTETALDILSRSERGFFLMVEAARIDMAGHDNDAVRWLWEGIACEKTIGVVRRFAQEHPETMVIVVPDHGTGGGNVIGIPGRDSTVVTQGFGILPYRLDDNGFPVNFDEGPLAIGWASTRQSLHARSGGGQHTAEDVGLSAMGPGAARLDGLVQNTDVFRAMADYLGVLDGAGSAADQP